MVEQNFSKVTVRNKNPGKPFNTIKISTRSTNTAPRSTKMATQPAKMARTPVTKAKFFTSTLNKKKEETKEKKKNPDLEEKLSVADLSGISVIETSPPPKRKVFFDDRRTEALKIKDEKVLRYKKKKYFKFKLFSSDV